MLRRLLPACWLALVCQALIAGEMANPQLAARYEQLLRQHPDSPAALDRLWKIYQEADAIPQLLASYAQKPQTFADTLVYGFFLHRAERVAEAKASFAKAAALDPKSPLPHLALARLIENPADAAAEWELAAQLDPKVETLLALGNAWQNAQRPEKAAAAWERAASLEPGNLLVHTQLAANYEQNHLPEQALAQHRLLASMGEPSQRVQAGQSAARILQSLHRPQEAEQALEQALTLLPPGNWQRAPIQSQLIRLAQSTGGLSALEQRWTEDVAKTPNDLGTYWKLADLFQELGDATKERAWLEKMMALAPEAGDVAARLARAERATGDARAAAKTLDALLQARGDESSLVFDRSDLDLQLDQPSAAVARLERLWQSHPDDEALRRRVLDFYRRARLQQPWERHLRESAAEGPKETVALARYLFAEHRREEARAALQNLVRSQDAPAAQADGWAQMAAELKEQNDRAAVVQALREAANLQPDQAGRRAALAEALAANDQAEEARQQMLAAWELEPSEVNDQKLFQMLQPRSPRMLADLSASDAVEAPEDQPAAEQGQQAFKSYLATIMAEAVKTPSAETLLRASRWLHWSHRSPEALALARRALKLAGDSVSARKQILRIAQALANRPLAQEQLVALSRLDPSNARDWRRQLGRAQMEAGNLEAALKTFSDLILDAPSDPAALSDLALAQQQADRWSDALATWQRAFALTPANGRRGAAQPLLRALEHLGLFQKGAELLLNVADGTSDPAVRDPALADVLAYAQQHALTPWLGGQLENRRRRDPADVPILRSLAQLKQTSGDSEGALQLLRQAAEQTPDDAALLREVVHAAAEMGRPDEAIAQQRRLVQMSSQNDPTEWEALARNEESAGEILSASATWRQIATRFPRDTEALKKCAGFFQRWQDAEASRQALRRVRVLAPDDLDALLALAREGSPEEAISCYQQILQRSRAPAADALTYPGVVTADSPYWQAMYFRALQLRNGRADGPLVQQFQELWRDGGTKPKSDEVARLEAIEAISRLLLKRGDQAAIHDWLRRWDSVPAGSEALHAHYFIGDRVGTGEVFAALLAARPDDAQLRQAFIYLSLQMGNYAELARWMAEPEHDPGDADLFMVGIARYAATAPRDPQWLAELFPPDSWRTYTAWQAAALLAGEGRLELAIPLGQKVFASASGERTTTGALLAQWLVSAGQIEAAREVLKGSLETTGSTLDDPVYAVLRHCVRLLPPEQRADFERAYLQRWRSSPLHLANARLLFAALGESRAELGRAVSELLRLAPAPIREGEETQTPAELRYWSYLANCGAQLQAWHLDLAARELWRQSLANPADVALRSGQVPEAVRELRLRALAARIIAAPAGERARLINDSATSASAPANGFATLAVMLENASCLEPAQAASRLAWQQDPANRQALLSLVNTSRAMGDLESARDALLAALSMVPGSASNPDSLRELYLSAATTLRLNNQRVAARKIIDQALAKLPGDPGLLERSAKFFAEDGEDEQAEKTYRVLLKIRKDSAPGRQGLQAVLRREGRDEEAVALEPPSIPASASSSGEPGARAQSAIASAKVLVAASRKEEAQWRLWSALAAELRPEFRFDLGWALLDLLPAGDLRTPLLLGQLRATIAQAPAGAEGYRARRNSVDPWEDRARRFYDRMIGSGIEALKTVRADWNGAAGDLQAGLALMRHHRAANDAAALSGIGRELIMRASDLSQRQLEEASAALGEAGFSEVTQALRQGSRLSALPSFEQIQQLEKQGRHSDALRLLDQLAARSNFDESLLAPVARQYDELREPAKARTYWELEIASDPAARKSESWLDYAAFLARQKDSTAASIFRRVYATRVTTDFRRLYDQLDPNGALPAAEGLIAELALSPAQETAFWRGLLLRWHEQQNFSGVIDLALAHREMTVGDRAALDAVRNAVLKTGRFAEVLAWLDPLTVERREDFPWLPAVTSRIYADWAITDEQDALSHAERAVQISPRDFGLTKGLCDRYLASGLKEKAREALRKFAAATRHVKDKATAENQLKSL